MTWVAVAVVGGAAIGTIGSSMAAGEQAQGQEQAANTQLQMFKTITGQEQPFLNAGYGATTALNKLLGLAPGDVGGLPNGFLTQTFNPTEQQLENYPGFKFSLQTGGQALRNADTPGVGALSGPALKDLMGFNQGVAQTYYGNYFNQFQTQQNNIFNRLAGIASLGQNAAGNLGNAGTQLGTGIAQAQAAAAGARAGGIVGTTNALSGGANTLAGLMYMNGGTGYAPTTSAVTASDGYTENIPYGG